MRRLSRFFLLLLLVELVIAFAIGLRIRREAERPTTYLGASGTRAGDQGRTSDCQIVRFHMAPQGESDNLTI